MTNSREIATQIFTEISGKEKFFETVISGNKDFNRLDQRDKAFVKLVVLGTLRRNGQIQKVIQKLIKTPLKKRNLFILNLIKISICQILFLGIKEYSVVNTAVDISKKYKLEKFVNGVLRNICRKKKELHRQIEFESNIPTWISNDVIKNLGGKYIKKLSDILTKEPPIDIKIKRNYLAKLDWEKILNGKFVANDVLRVKSNGPIEKKPYFDSGYWWIQGISSSLPVRFISEIFKKEKNENISVLEIGAAPGGKTFQLIEEGFNLTSVEISDRRFRRLKENLNRLKYRTNILCKNFFDLKTNKNYDCILIDAPCSATGLIQKKPEILLKNKEENINKLVKKQKQMLKRSADLIKSGGYIIYCVCSIHSKESIGIIDDFVKNNNHMEPIFLDNELCKTGIIIKKGMLMIIPDNSKIKGGMDGFFISILRKKL